MLIFKNWYCLVGFHNTNIYHGITLWQHLVIFAFCRQLLLFDIIQNYSCLRIAMLMWLDDSYNSQEIVMANYLKNYWPQIKGIFGYWCQSNDKHDQNEAYLACFVLLSKTNVFKDLHSMCILFVKKLPLCCYFYFYFISQYLRNIIYQTFGLMHALQDLNFLQEHVCMQAPRMWEILVRNLSIGLEKMMSFSPHIRLTELKFCRIAKWTNFF